MKDLIFCQIFQSKVFLESRLRVCLDYIQMKWGFTIFN